MLVAVFLAGDADGDGLRSKHVGGSDPDDGKVG